MACYSDLRRKVGNYNFCPEQEGGSIFEGKAVTFY